MSFWERDSRMAIQIPEFTIIVSLTAIGLGILSNIATRLLVDLRTERRMRKEVAEFDKELKGAMAAKDKQREEKLKKKKPQVDQMRMKASTGRLKVTLITWVPFVLLYYFMATMVGGYGAVVVNSPLPIPYLTTSGQMPLLWWYFISSLSFGTVISKLLGTQP